MIIQAIEIRVEKYIGQDLLDVTKFVARRKTVFPLAKCSTTGGKQPLPDITHLPTIKLTAFSIRPQ